MINGFGCSVGLLLSLFRRLLLLNKGMERPLGVASGERINISYWKKTTPVPEAYILWDKKMRYTAV